MAQKLRKNAVAQRYGGVNPRTIKNRWLRDPELKFPKPLYIGASPLWDESELEKWERTRATQRQESAA